MISWLALLTVANTLAIVYLAYVVNSLIAALAPLGEESEAPDPTAQP